MALHLNPVSIELCFCPQIRKGLCFLLIDFFLSYVFIFFLFTSSSSSDDSRISDLDEDPNLVINNSKSRSSPGELPGRSLKNNSRTIGSGTKSLSITEKIKSTNKKKDLSSDADSDFKSGNYYRLFFLRSIAEFFTQIYMNCFCQFIS